MHEFIYSASPARVIFEAAGVALLPSEIARLGLERVLLLSTPGQEAIARRLAGLIGPTCVDVFAGAAMHTPVAVTDQAMRLVSELAVDGVVAVGGGSAIDLSKAIAVRTDLPQIAVPTTYAGSEMTPILGETKDGAKVTKNTQKALVETVIYDVDLTLQLPPAISAASGVNAIAHAVEALYAKNRNPIIDMMAREGVRALAGALPIIIRKPMDRSSRSDAQYGAWLCGICLGSVGMSLHHKLCHTLGGAFGLPHAETHSVILPHALAYNAPHTPQAVQTLADVLQHPDPALALYNLAGELGTPRGLRDLGMPESAIDAATEQALANAYWNPRTLEFEAVRDCIARAWAGDPPRITNT